MRTGNVILVHNPLEWRKPKTYVYAALRRVTGSYFHHCAGFCWLDGSLYVVEAKESGVVKTLYRDWLHAEPKRITKVIEVEARQEEIICHLGKKYDAASFIFFCLIKILFKVWIGRKGEKADDQLYCFELWALIHKLPDWHMILPKQFIERLSYKLA